jgi:hypothetical protein
MTVLIVKSRLGAKCACANCAIMDHDYAYDYDYDRNNAYKYDKNYCTLFATRL